MIRTWRHKGLRHFYETGNKSGIQGKHAEILRLLLFQLTNAVSSEDMNTPGNDYHKLSGNLKDFCAVKVNKNWRVTFRFIGIDVFDVDYIDYH